MLLSCTPQKVTSQPYFISTFLLSINMFAIGALVSSTLLTVSLALTLATFFCRKILSISFNDNNAIYNIIKTSHPEIVDLTVDISFNSVCLEANGTTNCYTSFSDSFLSKYNVTLYSSSLNSSTNYLNLPQVSELLNHNHLYHFRNFLIVILIMVFVLMVSQYLIGIFGKLKFLSNLNAKLLGKLDSKKKSMWQRGELYWLITLNVLSIFITVHSSLNLSTVAEVVNQTSLNILHARVHSRFLCLIWANLVVLLVVLAIKLMVLQVGYYKRKNQVKIDIIQPKI